MNKTDLIAAVAQSAGLTKKDTERVLNAAFDAMTAALEQGEKVQLSGFGTKVPVFKPSKALKDNVAK